jgi:uncharacterized BrkB/YihY/UPF0761 family membrane protein
VSGAGTFILDLVEEAGLDRGFFQPLLQIAGPLVTLGLLILVFALMFQTFTVVKIPWKAAWRGGAVTGVVFAAGAIAVGFYFSLQADGGDSAGFSAGGFAGGAVLILFTVFILAQIFLFGAEFTKTYSDYVRHGDVVQPSSRVEDAKPDISADEVRAAATTDLIARVGVFSFLAGMVLGWFRRRS